jgi:hypothetical protein
LSISLIINDKIFKKNLKLKHSPKQKKKERKIEHQIWKKKKNEGVKLKNKKLSQIKRSKSKEQGYNLIYK